MNIDKFLGEFDWKFYTSYHKDLSSMKRQPNKAWEHFKNHGYREGRIINEKQLKQMQEPEELAQMVEEKVTKLNDTITNMQVNDYSKNTEKEIIKTNVNIDCSKIIKCEDECENISSILYKKYNAINAYIINMQNEIEKFNRSKNILNNALNINIFRFDAIVGKNITDRTNYFINCDEHYLSKYSNGQIGCFLSHMNLIYNYYYYSTEKFCLICEDDINYFNPHNLNIYQIIDNAPNNWEKIRLSYILDSYFYDQIIKNTSYYLTDKFTQWTTGTCSYIINKKGAKRILELFKDKKVDTSFMQKISQNNYDRFPIDKWLFNFENDYIYKYPIFTYETININNSTTTNNLNEIDWSNKSKTYICNTLLNIQLFNPDVSIILPTYNGLYKLKQTINSILDQTFKNFELIIIIDGSTDGTLDFITNLKCKLNDERIHIVFQENKKLPQSLNEGLIRCRGKYITWTSDDNYMLLDNIECFYKFLEDNKNIDFAYSGQEFFGEANYTFNSKLSILDIYFKYPGLASFMWTKKIINKVGYYNTDLIGIEDYDYILRTIELNNNIGFINKILYRYKYEINGNNMTSDIRLNNKLKYLNQELWKHIFKRNNDDLPSLDILFYDMPNISNEQKLQILKNTITKCTKIGVKEIILNNIKL
jgi:glycosyltransferase involved in cell wall biosynthesis/GR25 family glycosyltransferase involved in LPS biosynthesis